MVFPPGRGNLKLGEILDSHSAPQPLAASKDLGAWRAAGPGLHLHIRTLSKACQSMKRLRRSQVGLVDRREGAGENSDKFKIQHGLHNYMNNSFQAKRDSCKRGSLLQSLSSTSQKNSRQLGGCGLGFFWFVCFLFFKERVYNPVASCKMQLIFHQQRRPEGTKEATLETDLPTPARLEICLKWQTCSFPFARDNFSLMNPM